MKLHYRSRRISLSIQLIRNETNLFQLDNPSHYISLFEMRLFKNIKYNKI